MESEQHHIIGKGEQLLFGNDVGPGII
jgi:hypothetical protein